jgi:hypothetical protein
MPFQKGNNANPNGRPKGSKNKVTTDIVQLILKVDQNLTKAKKGLNVQAKADPSWFYEKIFAKVIPKDVNVNATVKHDISDKLSKALELKDKHDKNS